ncbi:protein-L-isoaspartate(D-aspartate) O-methyltransferase [Novosphingobium kunmingense]|uniref:Protein-L-isoaspartate O-methyltransferase n=1 Tax=Novosphingobium kunmingense TaxID=1211806 RepID=A0A2N0H500_9SPHN|nr:protein-L-isoaspartate O-methyltransferase [Novosphingobium kunmingense]PKB13992.1 protein-L-isoaspartate(D-aspartate) O-methyltransferase [Novosphingobium kunmingense]
MTVATLDSSAARKAMIDSQLRPSGVNDEWLLAAMGSIPREDFVPAAARGHAYIDRALPLDGGRALPAPLVHGRMLTEAALRADDKVLIVGCGSDYLAALTRTIASDVTVVPAADAARGVTGTYDLVLVDGAVEHLPQGLAAALADGGRIVTGLVERGVTRLAAGRKVGGSIALLPVADMGIPILSDFATPKSWSF